MGYLEDLFINEVKGSLNRGGSGGSGGSFVVNFQRTSETTGNFDKTFDEIMQAITEHKQIIAREIYEEVGEGYFFSITSYSEANIVFSSSENFDGKIVITSVHYFKEGNAVISSKTLS